MVKIDFVYFLIDISPFLGYSQWSDAVSFAVTLMPLLEFHYTGMFAASKNINVYYIVLLHKII